MTFDNYYHNYLGIADTNDAIVPCKSRNEIFCNYFRQLLIMGKYKENFYYSVAPQYYEGFKNNFFIPNTETPLEEHLLLIDEAFSYLLDTYRIQKMKRLTIENPVDFIIQESAAIAPLSELYKNQFLSLLRDARSQNYLENQWQKKKESIAKQNFFLYLIENHIASYSFISDIDSGGANIVVVTLPKYRQQGFGKAVVSTSVSWCFQNRILPIYIVEESNIASVKLAESLGFSQMTEEVIISVGK